MFKNVAAGTSEEWVNMPLIIWTNMEPYLLHHRFDQY